MQHRLKRGRGFIIRNANREAAALRVPPIFEGAARINDDAALTTPRRRPLALAPPPALGTLSPHLSRPYAGRAVRILPLPAPPPALGTLSPRLSRQRAAAAQPPAQPPAHPPPTLVSDPKHLSHTATLRFTNTDISSVPYKTP